MDRAPECLWRQQEEVEPGTILQHWLGAAFLAGFFGALPTGLIVYASIKQWDIGELVPLTREGLLSAGVSFFMAVFGLTFIWHSGSGAAVRAPERLCLLLLGSLPDAIVERALRVTMALSAALVASTIVAFFISVGLFARSFQMPLFQPVSPWTMLAIGIGAIAVLATVGIWLNGLLWIALFGALKVFAATAHRSFLIRPKVRRAPREFGSSSQTAVEIVHVSDFHITATAESKSIEGHPGGRASIERLIESQRDALCGAHLIVLTGDAVDSGHAQEWREFFDVFTKHDLAKKTFLVPGNHELNIADSRSWMRAMGSGEEWLLFRKLRFLGALRDTRSTDASMFTADKNIRTVGAVIDSHSADLHNAAAVVNRELKNLAQGRYNPLYSFGPPAEFFGAQRLIETVWDQVFPHWFQIRSDVVLVVLDSNARSSNLTTNAFGTVSETQLTKLGNIGSMFKGSRLVIAMHHHPIDPPGQSWSARFCGLTNSGALFGHLGSACTVEPVILNGHRHLDAASRVLMKRSRKEGASAAFVYASPSTSYGRDKSGPGFYRIGIEGPEASQVVTLRAWHGM